MNVELAVYAIVALLVLLAVYQVYRDRKAGKSWKEIATERAEDLDFTGLFRGRRSRHKDHDDGADDGPDVDFD